MNTKWNALVLGAAMVGQFGAAAWAGNAAQEVRVEAPYVRAVPPGTPNTGGFMVLKNSGSSAHAVVSGRSSASQHVELHTHRMEGGMMKMRPIEKIEIPAGGETVLKPGDLHVMFINLVSELKEGQEVGFTLVFEDGSETMVMAPVKKVMEGMKMGEGMGHGKKMH
ncbi:MAG: copper chaperone PCu(A)C [Proteobacteria bacterium]|nr:MAG: copper chaperone PCu(A)C [Pseudomonadota bacterium]